MARFPRLKRKESTPTRQVTGTTYTAPGAPNIEKPGLEEIGSSASVSLFDPVPDLQIGYQEVRTYLKMVRDDASTRVSLRAGKAPVLGAEYFIEPYSADPMDLAIQEFVEFNLFSGMTTPWIYVLSQILQMYESKRTVFETVWEQREWAPRKTNAAANRKQYTMLRKLAFRPPATVAKVNYDDNGGPIEIVQNAIDKDGNSKEVKIPINKAIVFVFDQQGGALEGMSILRSAYKHWWYKNRLYNIDSIQKERHGIGIPDIEISPGASQKDIALAHELGQNLRTNEKAYIVRPPTISVGFAQTHGQLVDVLKSAEHHDTAIMKNIMVQFLNMGATSEGGGSRAAGASQMDMFLKAMRYVANSICDCINMFLIPNLVAYNFPTDRFPRMSVRGVGEAKDLQMFSAAMRNLLDCDAISIDEDTEQWIRAQMDMPRLTTPWTPPVERPEKVQALLQGNIGGPGGKIAPGGPNSNNGGGSNGNVPIPGAGKAATGAKAGATSKNGGAGNVGKSESSAAV